MPRKSQVDEVGAGTLVLKLAAARLSIPEIQRRVQAERGTLITYDSVREYLRSHEEDLKQAKGVFRATDVSATADLEGLLMGLRVEVADRLKTFDDLKGSKDPEVRSMAWKDYLAGVSEMRRLAEVMHKLGAGSRGGGSGRTGAPAPEPEGEDLGSMFHAPTPAPAEARPPPDGPESVSAPASDPAVAP